MDNMITLEQWKILESSVELSARKEMEPNNVIYKAQRTKGGGRTQYLIYDNYDRYTSPGLNFMLKDGEEKGKLIVYNSSKKNYAPIDFKTGLKIAENFFNYTGTELSEGIVCDYLMRSPLYTVWVGGVEVCDEYLDNLDDAMCLADEYRNMGYDDIVIAYYNKS